MQHRHRVSKLVVGIPAAHGGRTIPRKPKNARAVVLLQATVVLEHHLRRLHKGLLAAVVGDAQRVQRHDASSPSGSSLNDESREKWPSSSKLNTCGVVCTGVDGSSHLP